MIRTEIEELQRMGPMPDESDDSIADEVINRYANILDAIQKPITIEEGNTIIKLFPEIALYGTEWKLLHLVESLYGKISDHDYSILIERCNSEEWRDTLKTRFNNGKNN